MPFKATESPHIYLDHDVRLAQDSTSDKPKSTEPEEEKKENKSMVRKAFDTALERAAFVEYGNNVFVRFQSADGVHVRASNQYKAVNANQDLPEVKVAPKMYVSGQTAVARLAQELPKTDFDLSQADVLIIDDDSNYVNVTSIMMTHIGMGKVSSTDNTVEGQAQIEKHLSDNADRPLLVFLDHNLTRELRASRRNEVEVMAGGAAEHANGLAFIAWLRTAIEKFA